MKKILYGVMAMIVAVAVVGCEPANETPTPEPKPEPTPDVETITVTYSPTSVNLLNKVGDSMEIMVSEPDFTVTVPAADTWLEATKNGAFVTFTVKELNPIAEVRTSNVEFEFSKEGVTPKKQTYTVSQEAGKAVVPVNPVIGTAYDKDGVKGVIFWVDPNDATKAKIVSTLCYGPQNWCNPGFESVEIATTEDNGKANMEAIAAAAGENIAEFLSYQSCKSEGEGWYLPSRVELENLLKGYYGVNDLTLLRNDICKNPSQMADPTICPEGAAALEARNKFEAALIALGGAKLNNEDDTHSDGTTYMTSTVNTANTTQVGYGCTGGPRISNAAKKASSPKRYTRCIMDVTISK
jgi:hypothetical protein